MLLQLCMRNTLFHDLQTHVLTVHGVCSMFKGGHSVPCKAPLTMQEYCVSLFLVRVACNAVAEHSQATQVLTACQDTLFCSPIMCALLHGACAQHAY